VREEFVRDYVFPMFRANALYEGQYLLGTSIARPLIAKHLIDIARKVGADAIAHGATGKGNDQVRFELSAIRARARHQDHRALARMGASPRAPRCSTFAEQHQIPIAKDKRGEAPFSVDANLLHVSSEGKVLEDPAQETPAYVYSRTVDPEDCAGQADRVEIAFENGDPVAVDGKALSPGDPAHRAQRARPRQRHRPPRSGREPLRRHEVARHVRDARRHDPARRAPRHRIDHARPRRGASQGRADAEIRRAHLQRLLVRARARDAAGGIDKSQEMVAGRVRLKLYKGNVQ
jgi:argininosuccinate synthase